MYLYILNRYVDREEKECNLTKEAAAFERYYSRLNAPYFIIFIKRAGLKATK